MRKVLFLDTVHSSLFNGIRDLGFEPIEAYDKNEEELRDYKDISGLIIRSRIPMSKGFLSAFENLNFIGRVGAGLENIDLDYCNNQDIAVFSAPEGNRNAVAEHCLGMLLSLLNNLLVADQEIRSGIWKREENRGSELSHKVVGIIGMGNMGSAFANLLSGFGCKILAYDKYRKDWPFAHVERVELDEIFEHANVLSFHVPLTDETKYYLDDKFVSKFKNPFYLLNTARGKVVETKALVQGLKDKKILGAGLDVLEYESSSFEDIFQNDLPEDFQYLLNSKRTILSPHIAGWTQESNYLLSHYLLQKIKKALENGL